MWDLSPPPLRLTPSEVKWRRFSSSVTQQMMIGNEVFPHRKAEIELSWKTTRSGG